MFSAGHYNSLLRQEIKAAKCWWASQVCEAWRLWRKGSSLAAYSLHERINSFSLSGWHSINLSSANILSREHSWADADKEAKYEGIQKLKHCINIIGLQNIPIWKGPTGSTESKPWIHTGPPQNQGLCLRVLPKCFMPYLTGSPIESSLLFHTSSYLYNLPSCSFALCRQYMSSL